MFAESLAFTLTASFSLLAVDSMTLLLLFFLTMTGFYMMLQLLVVVKAVLFDGIDTGALNLGEVHSGTSALVQSFLEILVVKKGCAMT